MTGVQKLPLLPAPGAKPKAPAVALSRGSGVQPEIEAVVKSPAARSRTGQRSLPHERVEERRWEEQRDAARRARFQDAAEPAKGRRISFSRLTAMPFMVQVLGQQSSGSQITQQTPLVQHRDGALIGSELYRKAGGEPELLPEEATFVRIAT